MGQNSSSRRSTSSSFSRKLRTSPGGRRRSKRKELSDTFNLLNEDFPISLMNINTATEEELMTLRGITRATAHDIVEYRQRIGQFKKVEDLALVSGVGANKLAAIKAEICVNNRHKGLSRSSSCGTPSEDSSAPGGDPSDATGLRPPGSLASLSWHQFPASQSGRPLDVNSATMFDLMAVRNINQLLAANIVHHREKKGPFKSLDEMGKVKGLNYRLLGELKQYLSVDPEKFASAMANGQAGRRHRRSSSVPPVVAAAAPYALGDGPVANGAADAARDKLSNGNKLVYEMLASRCTRPGNVERFAFRRKRQPALRLATWNLDRLTAEKADNLGVIEVFCLTILENGISLIAVQELGDSQVLEKICKELNNPTLKNVQDWVGLRGAWKCLVSDCISPIGNAEEHLGFLYDTRRGIARVASETLNFPQPNNNGPTFSGAFYATFKAADNIQFSLLNVHLPFPSKEEIVSDQLDSPSASAASLATIVPAWLEKVKDVSVLNDRFSYLVRSGETTNAREEDIQQYPCFDNVWMSTSVKKFHTGNYDVISEGLYHLAIPKGWSWGGHASAHCPVWAEFFVPSLSTLQALTDEIERSPSSMSNGSIGTVVESKTGDGLSSPDGENSSHECDCSTSNASENSF